MKRFVLSILILLAACAVANARLSQAQLAPVSVDAKPDAPLPLEQAFTDEDGRTRTLGDAIGGRPAVVVFADYTCRTLCGPVLAFAVSGLEQTGLVAGSDFRLIVIGIDPKDSLADARAMKASHIGTDTAIARATMVLSGDADAIREATTAAGYRYAYDDTAGQFAHPAAAYVVTAQGHVSRVLSGLGLDATNLRLALVDAGQGRVGTFADHIRLLCYGFDPATGIYSAAISRIMLGAGIVTVVAMAGGILLLTFLTQRRAQP